MSFVYPRLKGQSKAETGTYKLHSQVSVTADDLDFFSLEKEAETRDLLHPVENYDFGLAQVHRWVSKITKGCKGIQLSL